MRRRAGPRGHAPARGEPRARHGSAPGGRGSAWRKSPDETLGEIRERALAGLPLDRPSVRNTGLFERARRHFGSWYAAVQAAGLRLPRAALPPKARWRPRDARPARRARLTEAMLRGPLSTWEIARRTGMAIKSLRERRRALGARDSGHDPPWVAAVRDRLGKAPDADLARRAGVSAASVARVRRRMGILLRRWRP